AALGAQRHLDRVGENIDAAQHALAGVSGKFNVLGCLLNFLLMNWDTVVAASLPGLTRQTITLRKISSEGDGCPGVKPGHDEWCAAYWFTSGDHAHDVALLHDQEFLAIELDLGARPFAEQHAIADLEVDRDQLAGLVAAARADRRDFALRGLFL